VVYLHISSAGPLLGSGFWLIASERFDPRTAKKRFGQIAGAGTLGGLVSALLAERIAAVFGVPAMLPFLALLSFFGAWLVRQVALESLSAGTPASNDESLRHTPAFRPPRHRQPPIWESRGPGPARHDRCRAGLFKAQVLETFGRAIQRCGSSPSLRREPASDRSSSRRRPVERCSRGLASA
jgi:hypothetical protein